MAGEIRVVATSEEEEEERNFTVAQGNILEAGNILFLALGGHYTGSSLYHSLLNHTLMICALFYMCYIPIKMLRGLFSNTQEIKIK